MSTVTQTTPTGVDPTTATPTAWQGFAPGPWQDAIDVRDFLQRNYTPYAGDASFLAGPTERTTALWQRLTAMFPTERERGVYDIDAGRCGLRDGAHQRSLRWIEVLRTYGRGACAAGGEGPAAPVTYATRTAFASSWLMP